MKRRIRRVIGLLLSITVLISLATANLSSVSAVSAPGNIDLSYRVATEGMVLLENENNTLPIDNGATVAIFGLNQINYIKGGTGSGNVTEEYVVDMVQGLKNREADGQINIYQPLLDSYLAYKAAVPNANNRIESDAFSRSLLNAAAAASDVAIVTFGRTTGESSDRSASQGDYYLSAEEKYLLDDVTARFDHVIGIINVGTVMDTSWIDEYKDKGLDAVLMAGLPGMEGGNAIADVLVGNVNPSGKLADTYAKNWLDYPSSETWLESQNYVNYTEDIYVGYRYFETIPGAAEKVNYEFGYGLSYTTFDISDVTVSNDGVNINVSAKVTNTGDVAGKEVVQVYYGAPQGLLGKPAKELAIYAKTDELEPGQSQVLNMSYAINDMASYDDLGKVAKSAYVLEAGTYTIYVGNSVRNVEVSGTYNVAENTITEQLTEQMTPVALEKRMLADGTYETLPTGGDPQVIQGSTFVPEETEPVWNAADDRIDIMLIDVYENPALLPEFMAQFTDQELATLSGGHNTRLPSGATGGIGDLPRLGVPNGETADGPAGIRFSQVTTTRFPNAALLASTWNMKLQEEVGKAIGVEAKMNGVDMWLAPGINIHRNPLCGRNFEYYSEDPVLTGKTAAAVTKGVQSENVAVTLKHYAANNKELNRTRSDSRASERALREIYLKAFEIPIKEADSWCVMSSYNYINGMETAESYALLTTILRDEWGFSGFVMTDWGNNTSNDREAVAGNDVKMRTGSASVIMNALAAGTLTRAELERNIGKIVTTLTRMNIFQKRLTDSRYDILNYAIDLADEAIANDELDGVMEFAANKFFDAYNHARAVLTAPLLTASHRESDVEQVIMDATFGLLDSMADFSYKVGDKTNLLNVISIAEQIVSDKDLYIPSTYAPFEEALAAAIAVANDGNVTDDDITPVWQNLLTAMANLRRQPSKEKLEELLQEAQAIDTALYTDESVLILSNAIVKGLDVLENLEATEKDVIDVEDGLTTAMKEMEPLDTDAATDNTAKKDAAAGSSTNNTNNTKNTTPAGAKNPKTGEDTAALGFAAVLLLSGAGLLILKKRSMK